MYVSFTVVYGFQIVHQQCLFDESEVAPSKAHQRESCTNRSVRALCKSHTALTSVCDIKHKQQRYNSMSGPALQNPVYMMMYRVCTLHLHLDTAACAEFLHVCDINGSGSCVVRMYTVAIIMARYASMYISCSNCSSCKAYIAGVSTT